MENNPFLDFRILSGTKLDLSFRFTKLSFLKFSQWYGEETGTWKTLDITRGVVNILLNRMLCCYWHEERQKHNPTVWPYSTLRLIVSIQEPIILPSSLCFVVSPLNYFWNKTALKSSITSDVLSPEPFLFTGFSESWVSWRKVFFETKRMLNLWLWKRPWSVRKTFSVSTGTQQYNYMGYCGPSVRAGYWPSSFFEY